MSTARIIIVVIALAAIIGGFFVLRQKSSAPAGGEHARPIASETLDLEFRDYDGRARSLRDFSGKPMVVNSWAAWCPFCKDELDDFAKLREEFGDRITVIAVDRAEPLETAKGFTDSTGVTDRFTFLLDSNDSFYKSIGGFSMPETVFVDAEGNVRVHKRGPMRFEEMKEKVESILK